MTILDQSLGQLARSIPGATAIFHNGDMSSNRIIGQLEGARHG